MSRQRHPAAALRPELLRPYLYHDLQRLGRDHDGGYVVPHNVIRHASALLSFGIYHDWSFEREFHATNRGAIIHAYDHTVTWPELVLHVVKSAMRAGLAACRLSRSHTARHLAGVWAPFDYLLFFHRSATHYRERLWHTADSASITLKDAFARLPISDRSNVIVKMDIEGSEFRILDHVLDLSPVLDCLVIEFHDLDILGPHLNAFIRDLSDHMSIIHVHGNNYSNLVPSLQMPSVIEVTFLNNRFLDAFELSRASYPIPGLDQPCDPDSADIALRFK